MVFLCVSCQSFDNNTNKKQCSYLFNYFNCYLIKLLMSLLSFKLPTLTTKHSEPANDKTIQK